MVQIRYIKKEMLYLCVMEQQTLGIDRDFFISFFLPDGMIDWFEVVHMSEENNPGTTIADKLYNRILNIYLDERDNRSEDQAGLKPNGFTEPTVIKDYPIRNRKVLLHVRRRRYLDADGRNVILNQYPLNPEGTKVSVEYGLFFKDDHGQPAINCRALREAISD